jgi:hypothetical protein
MPVPRRTTIGATQSDTRGTQASRYQSQQAETERTCTCLAGKGSGVRIPDAPPETELRSGNRWAGVPGFWLLDHNSDSVDHDCEHLPDDHLLDRGQVCIAWPRDVWRRSAGNLCRPNHCGVAPPDSLLRFSCPGQARRQPPDLAIAHLYPPPPVRLFGLSNHKTWAVQSHPRCSPPRRGIVMPNLDAHSTAVLAPTISVAW